MMVLRVSLSISRPAKPVVLQGHGFSRQTVSEQRAALLDLEFLGAIDRNAQAHGDVVVDMVAPDAEHAALDHGAFGEENVVGLCRPRYRS